MAGRKKKPNLEIKMRGLDTLTPYATNPRTHSKRQIGQIAELIQEYGWTNPILIDPKGGIIAGHGRVEVARLLGAAEVPTITLTGLSEAQRRAYVIADNKFALNAGWDPDLLAAEFTDLMDLDFDLALTGFDPTEINDIFAEQTGAQEGEDDVPDEPLDPVTKPGDVWILGTHRLLCGDATVAKDVEKLLDGVEPHLMVTDPPYGVSYDPDWRNRAERADGTQIGASSLGEVDNDEEPDWTDAWKLFPGDVAYIWHASLFGPVVQGGLIDAGFEMRSQIIWAKQRAPISRGHYHWQHEACFYAVKKGSTGHWSGDRKQTTLWTIQNLNYANQEGDDTKTNHSTQKPVECMRRPILNNSSPGQAVYDPFLGSGTTLIAAETTGRSCLGIELNPAYVDMAVERWETFTGETAHLEGTKKTLAKLRKKAARAA